MALTDTPTCNFGWKAAHIDLLDAKGTKYTLKEIVGRNGFLIAFICNHCPYVRAIAEDFSRDAKTLRRLGIGVAAIMPNDYQAYPDDNPLKMLEFAASYSFDFPYLIDVSQETASTYGAVCTPDFFGFNASSDLQYRGRLDNLGINRSGERIPELLNAMRIIAETGQGPANQIASLGCSIKWRS